MGSAVVVGLILVLVVQVAIHLRIARIPVPSAAQPKPAAKAGARVEPNAPEEVIVRRAEVLFAELQRVHDAVADDHRAEVVAAHQRARIAEVRNTDAAKVLPGLRASTSEAVALVSELRTLTSDLADLVYALTERLAGGAPAQEQRPPEVKPGDNGDARRTLDMGPPSTGEPQTTGGEPPFASS